jgi:catechol 2,3-dioxygenase
VSRLNLAEAFYVETLGFDLIQHYSGQAAFVSAGGYHHHLGMNTWAGVGAPPAPEDAARLLWYEVVLPNAEALDAVVAQARAAGVAVEAGEEGWLVRDPSQNLAVLRI